MSLKIQALHGIEDGIHFSHGEFHTNGCAWASGVLETPHGDVVASDGPDYDLNLNAAQVEWLVANGCTLDVEPVDHAQEVFLPDGRNLAEALREAQEDAESDLETAIHEATAAYVFNVGLESMLRYEPACCEQYRDYKAPEEEESALNWANENGMLNWDMREWTISLELDGETQVESFEIIDYNDNCGGSISTTDFRYRNETLCRLSDGAYIVIGYGGSMTRWAQTVDQNSVSGGSGIIVPTGVELEQVWDID
jgi:hypothetical protein